MQIFKSEFRAHTWWGVRRYSRTINSIINTTKCYKSIQMEVVKKFLQRLSTSAHRLIIFPSNNIQWCTHVNRSQNSNSHCCTSNFSILLVGGQIITVFYVVKWVPMFSNCLFVLHFFFWKRTFCSTTGFSIFLEHPIFPEFHALQM